MSKAKIYNIKGETVGDLELSDKVFGVKVNETLVHQAVITQQANERQVLAHTKGRAEVSGGGKKPWKQKGTGRARQGSIRAPQWIGGGVVFGPLNTRNFSKKINKKMKLKAMLMALSDRVLNNNLVVLDKLEMGEYKTKTINSALKNIEKILMPSEKEGNPPTSAAADSGAASPLKKGSGAAKKRSLLVINDKKDEKVSRSGKNLVGVEVMNLDNINIVDILKYKSLVLTVDGVKKLEERYK